MNIFRSFGRFRICDPNLPSLGRRFKFFLVGAQVPYRFPLNVPSLERLSTSSTSWKKLPILFVKATVWPVGDDQLQTAGRTPLVIMSQFYSKNIFVPKIPMSSSKFLKLQFGQLEFGDDRNLKINSYSSKFWTV